MELFKLQKVRSSLPIDLLLNRWRSRHDAPPAQRNPGLVFGQLLLKWVSVYRRFKWVSVYRRCGFCQYSGASQETLPKLAGPIIQSYRKKTTATLLATISESSIRGLDLDIALTLGTSRESKRTLRSIDDDALGALVWVVDKLVKSYT